jgi:SAM-dependent methyltransferase
MRFFRGLHSVLSLPSFYNLYQTVTGGVAARAKLIAQYVRPEPGDHILDIGCGPGYVVRFLPAGVRYVGFDESAVYIRAARRRYGQRAVFHCERVREKTLAEGVYFDSVLAFGILHHLDDREALDLFRLALQGLRPGGRLFTLDGCYVPGQSAVARWLLDKDRGKNIRTREEYVRLAQTVFADVSASIRHDLFWVPYTALVLECRRPRRAEPGHRDRVSGCSRPEEVP